MTTTGQTEQGGSFLELILSLKLEKWELNTSNVISTNIETHVRPCLHMVHHIARNVTSSEVSSSQTELGLFELIAHADLCFDNLLKNGTEGLLESVRLLLEQLETFLRAHSFGLVELQIPTRFKR